MKTFEPKTIKDPKTGKKRLVSVEEQMLMLEKGIIFDAELEPPADAVNDSEFISPQKDE